MTSVCCRCNLLLFVVAVVVVAAVAVVVGAIVGMHRAGHVFTFLHDCVSESWENQFKKA